MAKFTTDKKNLSLIVGRGLIEFTDGEFSTQDTMLINQLRTLRCYGKLFTEVKETKKTTAKKADPETKAE